MDKIIRRPSGNLKISNDVIVKIAELAALEISGVTFETKTPDSPLSASPVKIKLSGDSIAVDVRITVAQGSKAVCTAEAVQKSVKSAVQNMTGIAVSKVNVKIAGIIINKEETA